MGSPATAKRKTRLSDAHAPAPGRRSVYDLMKADILSLALAPGRDLDEVSLSRRYGVSRTPIREALIRLSEDRLIVFGQNRRAMVTPLILADYPRFVEALALTRRAVSRLAAFRRHDADMLKMRAAQLALVEAARSARVGNDKFARYFTPLETALHLAIAEAGHNGYLTRSYEHLLTVGHRMLHLPYGYDARPGEPLKSYVRRAVDRHSDLIDAIEAGDAATAETTAQSLTDDLVRRLRSYFEENLAADLVITSPGFDDEAPKANVKGRVR